MAPARPICRRFTEGQTAWGNPLTPGRYHAAVYVDQLPRAVHRDDRVIYHGWAVGCAAGWFFFGDLPPAIAFGRAARMSLECSSGYGVYRAAHETYFCPSHGDERVLLLTCGTVPGDRHQPDEVEVLKRFVQSVKEHPWSSNWHDPTGYMTEYDDRGNS
jgi:hypothetical protein